MGSSLHGPWGSYHFINASRLKSGGAGQSVPGRLSSSSRSALAWLKEPDFRRTLDAADMINLCNLDELAYVRDQLRLGEKCLVQPFGLTAAQQAAFRAAQASPHEKLARKEVVFIGQWGLRKGSGDWGAIVAGFALLFRAFASGSSGRTPCRNGCLPIWALVGAGDSYADFSK